MVLLVITIIKWNKMGADRKEEEKKCATKHVTGIQNQKDLESFKNNHKHQGIIKKKKRHPLPITANGQSMPDNGKKQKKKGLQMGGW